MENEFKEIKDIEVIENLMTDTVKERLCESLSCAVKRFCIDTTFGVEVLKSRGRTYIKLTSGLFNSTPRIYKSIHLEGYASLFAREDGVDTDFYKISIGLGYRFDYFGGGANGVDLCTVDGNIRKSDENVNLCTATFRV